MVTMKEVAKKAGVSQSTVSRVINNNPSVDPQTREIVLKWIKKLGYIPSSAAQTMVRKRSNLIGVLISEISNPYFSEVLRLIERETAENNYNIIFRDSQESVFVEKRAIEEFLMRNVDGILLVPRSPRAEHLKILKTRKVPVVCITRILEGHSGVAVSHERGGEIVAQHLFEQGYENFLFVGPESDEKFLGFKKWLNEHGIKIDRRHVIPVLQKGVFSSDQVKNRLKGHLESGRLKKSTGIFTSNDLMGIEVLEILKEYDFKIPEEIGVVGFDNTYLSKLSNFKLSSIAQPISEMVKAAVEILMLKIGGELKFEEKIVENFEPRIVIRKTSSKSIKSDVYEL